MPSSINSTTIQLEQLLVKINQRMLTELPSAGTVRPHEINTSPKVREMENWARQINLHVRRLKQVEGLTMNMRNAQT